MSYTSYIINGHDYNAPLEIILQRVQGRISKPQPSRILSKGGEMNYTKGEWKISEYEYQGLQVCNEYENICKIVSSDNFLANAHLIAAAPNMCLAGQELDSAIGKAIIEIAKTTILDENLADIVKNYILPAQETWRKALAKANGEGS